MQEKELEEKRSQEEQEDYFIKQTDNRPRCEECHRPFDPATSTKGHLGICQDCAS